MAGMLPGVEFARRRRFHQSGLDSPSSGSGHGLTRRSSFCLYPTNHESSLNSSIAPTVHRCPESQALIDHKLGDVAREAKRRLDTRLGLHHQRKPEPERNSSNLEVARQIEQREIGTEIRTLKRGGSKRFNWPKLGWKSSEQKECAVCLEQFRTGEKLMHLPCAHRFHSQCLLPWLDNNSHCPCCRLELV